MPYIHELPATQDISDVLSLKGCPFTQKRPLKVHILALGDVGMTMLIGLRLLGRHSIESIGICDIKEENVKRLEMEINQIRYPFDGPTLPPVHVVTEKDLFQCDVFIFCASKGVPPIGVIGDVRMAQLEANRGLIKHFATLAKDVSYKGLVCIVSDPVDPLCVAFLDESSLAPWQIQGYGLGVMNARALYYAEKDGRFASYKEEGRAFGPHGEDLVIANGIESYDDELSRELTKLVTTANIQVRNLGYKPYIAPALSSAALSILLTLEGKYHYGSIYLGNDKKGAFFGVKNRYTEQGLEYEDLFVCDALFTRLSKAYGNLCAIR